MKRLAQIVCLVAALIIGILPVLACAETNYGYYYVKTSNGKSLNLRSEAYKADNVVAQLPYRTQVLVYEYNAKKTWAYVEAKNPNGSGTVKGWVQTSFLVKKDPGAYKPSGDSGDVTVKTIDDINRAAKAIKVLDTSYFTVIKTTKATNYVHLRVFPDTNAVFTGAYLCDTEIEVLAESKTWAQVRIVEDGKVGFILKSCVTPVE